MRLAPTLRPTLGTRRKVGAGRHMGFRNYRLGRVGTVTLALLALVAVATRTARAANHLWDLSELYSNSSGSVQFVEMHDDFNIEGFLQGLTLTATDSGNTQSHIFTFPTNLP